MPVDLARLLDPAHVAVVANECQRGVIGDHSVLPELAAAAAPVIRNIARLATGARRAGVPVVHTIAVRRPDGRGANTNARLFMATRRSPQSMVPGSPAAEIVAEIGADERDFVLPRLHGVSPMHGTELDPVLRNLGVRTIVAVGVSVNIALTNLVFDAVNASYQVVVPRDAVAGVPASYAEAVLANTVALLATLTTTDEVLAAWR